MTDTDLGGAPEGVPIDTPQVDTPAPVSNQPPEAAPEPKPEVEDKKPSLRESIAKADAKVKEKQAEAGKPKDEAKPDVAEPAKEARAPDAKQDKKESPPGEDGAAEKPATVRGGDDARQSEGRKQADPPARFLPEAREKWGPTPREVKAEVHRMSEELQEHRDYRESLREYEDMAGRHGVTVKDTMARYVAADQALNRDFGSGVAQMAQMYGHSPADAIASVMRAYGVSPQQFVQHAAQNPQPQRQQTPSVEHIVETAVGRMQQVMEHQQFTQQVTSKIDQFAATHPDYRDLEKQIESVLRSGVIDNLYGAGLPPEQKLAEAYRMVGGRKATSHEDPATVPEDSQPATPRQANPAGQRSIAGARSPGPEPVSGKRASPSLRAALERAVSRSGL